MRNCGCKITETTLTTDRICPECKCYRLTKEQWRTHERIMIQELGMSCSCDDIAYYDGEEFPTDWYYESMFKGEIPSIGIVLDHNVLLTELKKQGIV